MNRSTVSRADVRRIERTEYTLFRVTMETHDGEDGWSVEYEADFVIEEEAEALAHLWRRDPRAVRLCAGLHSRRMPLSVDEWKDLIKRSIAYPEEGYLDFSCRFFAWLQVERWGELDAEDQVEAIREGWRGYHTWDDVAQALREYPDAGERWLEEQVLVFTGGSK